MDKTRESDRNRGKSYRKDIVEQTSGNKIKQKLFSLSTNITYSIGGTFNRFKSFISADSSKQHVIYYIHGKKFSSEEQASAYIKKIIWFSYRKIPGLSQKHHSDTGWGCLIRVGQMALAAGLKKFLQSKKGQKALTYQEVVVAFLQNGRKLEKYSLKKIVQCGKIKYPQKIDYGKWFNSPQICDILAHLHTKDPMRGTQNLSILLCKDAAIYLDEVFQKLNKKMCNCMKRRILCETCLGVCEIDKKKSIESLQSFSFYQPKKEVPDFNSQNKMRPAFNTNVSIKQTKTDKKLLLFVTARVGFEKVDVNKFKQLQQILKMECSLGIIGGVPRKGYYFVGCTENQLIYLDPHYVQEQVTLDQLHLNLRSFQTKEVRKVSRQQVDPSMAFLFYIDGLQTLRKLQMKIQELQQNDDPIFMIEWVNEMKEIEESKIDELQESNIGDMENSFIFDL